MLTRARHLLLLLPCTLALLSPAHADPVPVRHRQGSQHGLLVLRSAAGKVLATGDLLTLANGDDVHSRLTLRFLDGSLDDEATDYRQSATFKLVRDHHIQKGPSFATPVDTTVDMAAQTVTTTTWKDGKEDTKVRHMELPADLSNGLTATDILNYPRGEPEMHISYLAEGATPRVVSLTVKPDGVAPFKLAGLVRHAARYNIHLSIGGMAGAIAMLLSKDPPDMKFWMLPGQVPAFLRFRGEFFLGGPSWTLVFSAPSWSAPS
jgi:hypothetical protein